MKYKIEYGHAFSLLLCDLDYRESMFAESDAMVYMTGGLSVEGSAGKGGFLGGLARAMLTNESFFVQTISAKAGPGTVAFAPAELGSVEAVDLDGSYTLSVQKGGFLAATSGINVGTKMQNLTQGLASREGFFIQEMSGRGTVFISSFGAIHPLTLGSGEEAVIDNGHLVAWPSNMDYRIEKAASGFISSVTSGEGLVCRFRGPGTILIQTRKPGAFYSMVASMVGRSK